MQIALIIEGVFFYPLAIRRQINILTQLSQLGIEIGTFDSARVVSFHHKPYYPTDGYTLLVVVALAILP